MRIPDITTLIGVMCNTIIASLRHADKYHGRKPFSRTHIVFMVNRVLAKRPWFLLWTVGELDMP
jgi:hypothetical protein